MASEAPEDSAVRIRGASVECIAIIQLNHDLERVLRFSRPLQDFLSPEHPEVVVNTALGDELALRCIPKEIVGAG
jgi:hypothetical protein